jgi:hypothetical protein
MLARIAFSAQVTSVSRPIVFIDFEASALLDESWPIEVGYASSTGQQDAFLIARDKSWSLEQWDRRSEAVHGISLADLECGLEATEALTRLEDGVGDALVVCDAPEFDNFWLNRLADAAGRPPAFVIRDWCDVLPTGQSLEQLAALTDAARKAEKVRHRALPDARVLRAIWQASWVRAGADWAPAEFE